MTPEDHDDVTQGSERALTPLESCLMHICAELNHPVTEAALFARVSSSSGELLVRDAVAVAERAGLQAAFGKRGLGRIDNSLTPCILMLNDGRAVVLHEKSRKTCTVYDPEMGEKLGKIPIAKLKDAYAGYAILVRQNQSEDLTQKRVADGHWFWSAIGANRWIYSQVALAAMLTNLLGLSTSIFTMVVYDRILPNEATESLVALTVGIGIALTFDFILKMLRASFIDRAGEKADLLMGRRIFDQLLDIRMSKVGGSTGALAGTLREFETLRDFFTSASIVALVDLPFTLLFIFVIYLIGGPLAYIPAVAVPTVLIVGIFVQPFLRRLAESSFDDGQTKQSVLVETISGLESVKASGASRFMRARWEDAIAKQSRHSGQSRAITQFALNATGFVQQFAQVMIIFFGFFLISSGQTSMGALIASVILMGRCLAPMAQLAQTLTRANSARTSYRRLNALMQSGSERPQDKSWISRPSIAGKVEFDDVSFTYPNQLVETLKNVSFTIEAGEKVAILGPIGSGKSTIGRLLLGLHQPTNGAVRVDSVDIRQVDPGDLRRNVGSVLQDNWLFSGTLQDNIAIGSVRPTHAQILDAAKTAGVDDFVSRHPAGYDMMLGEKGEGLSGGQKQAICLARALVGDPPIMLFDEPTSSMDVRKEAEIIANLKDAMSDRTLIVITHRTSLLDLVDRVIVIGNGTIQADGPKSILRRAPGASEPAAKIKGVGA